MSGGSGGDLKDATAAVISAIDEQSNSAAPVKDAGGKAPSGMLMDAHPD